MPRLSRITINCSVCGQEMSVPPHLINKRTCSLSCLRRLRRKFYRKCRQCGEQINSAQGNKRNFCSRTCYHRFVHGPNHPAWVADRIRTCKNCGEKFEALGKQKQTLLCSLGCWNSWRKEHGRSHRAPLGHVTRHQVTRRAVKVAEGKYRPEHRVVMEKHLGRNLSSDEVIHHIDGNSSNNHIGNLLVVTQSEHVKIHREAEKIGLAVMVADNWIPSVEGMAC